MTRDKYSKRLTREEVKVHPAWQAAVEYDRALLEEYVDIYFKHFAHECAMDFSAGVQEGSVLISLSLIHDHSSAIGYAGLNSSRCFILLPQQQEKKENKQK